jgi:hypothetical protein
VRFRFPFLLPVLSLLFVAPFPGGLRAMSLDKDIRFRIGSGVFPDSSAVPGGGRTESYLLANPRMEVASEDGRKRIAFEPIAYAHYPGNRFDWDVSELSFSATRERWRAILGVSRIFWGITEGYNPQDVFNQRDLRVDWRGEQKLGQPMAGLSYQSGWGTLGAYLATGFREMRFRTEKERLNPFPFEFGEAAYESEYGEWHPEAFLRWEKSSRFWEAGLSFFRGNGREPYLTPLFREDGSLRLIPTYVVQNQIGADITALVGQGSLKAEGIARSGKTFQSYFRYSAGVEYGFQAVMESDLDATFYAEHLYSSEAEPLTYVDNDVFLGMRLDINDAASTSVESGVIVDLDSRSTLPRLEVQRRLLPYLVVAGVAQAFLWVDEEDILVFNMRQDTYASLELRFFF